MNIIDAIDDRNVLRRHFRGDTWLRGVSFFAALFALPMNPSSS